MRLGAIFWRAGIELVDHEIIRKTGHTVVPEQAPRHCDVGGIGHRLEKILHRAVAAADVHELVHIDVDNPVGVLDHRFPERLVERVLLGRIPFPRVVVAVLENAHFLKPVEDFCRAILAPVCIDEEIVHPHRPVIGDPFDDIGCFVLHAPDDDGTAAAGGQCALRNRGIGRGARFFVDGSHPVVRGERGFAQLLVVLHRKGGHDIARGLCQRIGCVGVRSTGD